MSDDAHVGNVWNAIFAAGILLFLLAAALLYVDHACDQRVADNTRNLVNECCGTGKISAQNYEQYARKVAGLGNYEIRLEHKALVVYGSSGHVDSTYEGYYNEQILDYMFSGNTNENYEMKSGDYFTITVIKRGSDFAALWNDLTTSSSNGLVVTDYGNVVGD